MPFDVTSSFIHQSRSKSPNIVRKFTIGSSDYSQYVDKWPKFKRRWDEIRPTNVMLTLANADNGLDFLRNDKTILQNQSLLSMGFKQVEELVTNGGFDTAAGWTTTGGWSISGGVADSNGTDGILFKNIGTLEVGAKYLVTFDVVQYTSGIVRLNNTNGPFRGTNQDITAVGTYVLEVTCTHDDTLEIESDLFDGQIDNVSVKQDETIDIFAGTIRSVSYQGTKCRLTLVDKFQQLSDRKVGTNDDPVEYVGSNYLPSDLALWAITSYGGFDATANSSNPDIMWEDFSSWAYVFSSDTVYMEARWTGQKVTEVLRKIARQTHSAITISDNKISFKRFGLADTNVSSLGDDQIKDIGVSFDLNTIVNKQSISGDFVVGSTHQFTIEEVDSASVNSFGAKENLIEDQNLWYVNSASAINLAERLIRSNAEPDDYITVTAGLAGLPRQVGETVAVIHPFYSLSESYRILEHMLDMDRGLIMMGADRRQLTNQFILDTSSLNSTTDVLT